MNPAGQQVVGLVLAAGEGRRLGQPKALVTDAAGETWLARAVRVIRGAGVVDVTVVVGAAAGDVRSAAPDGVVVVEATDWSEGMGASLRTGLRALGESAQAQAAVVMLVDTPDIGTDVVSRLLAEVDATSLARATYGGRPGHPVVLGRSHWAGVVDLARGDRGARDYLVSHPPTEVECGDLSSGTDVDTPEGLASWELSS